MSFVQQVRSGFISLAQAINESRSDKRFLTASVPAQDVNANNVRLNLTPTRSEVGWLLHADNLIEWVGPDLPDYINFFAKLSQGIAATANIQRPAPGLVLQHRVDVSAPWQVLDESWNGYIRDITGHERSTNTIFHAHVSPQIGHQFELLTIQESTNGGVVTSRVGQLNAKAVIKR